MEHLLVYLNVVLIIFATRASYFLLLSKTVWYHEWIHRFVHYVHISLAMYIDCRVCVCMSRCVLVSHCVLHTSILLYSP